MAEIQEAAPPGGGPGPKPRRLDRLQKSCQPCQRPVETGTGRLRSLLLLWDRLDCGSGDGMAYTTGFEYDLFISYAAVNDIEPVTDDGRGWVTMFVRNLEMVLASRLGGREKLRIYFDRRNLGGNHEVA
jgi:hypothetical protein